MINLLPTMVIVWFIRPLGPNLPPERNRIRAVKAYTSSKFLDFLLVLLVKKE